MGSLWARGPCDAGWGFLGAALNSGCLPARPELTQSSHLWPLQKVKPHHLSVCPEPLTVVIPYVCFYIVPPGLIAEERGGSHFWFIVLPRNLRLGGGRGIFSAHGLSLIQVGAVQTLTKIRFVFHLIPLVVARTTLWRVLPRCCHRLLGHVRVLTPRAVVSSQLSSSASPQTAETSYVRSNNIILWPKLSRGIQNSQLYYPDHLHKNRLNDRGTHQWAGGRVEEVIDTEKKLGQFKKTQTSSALVFAL